MPSTNTSLRARGVPARWRRLLVIAAVLVSIVAASTALPSVSVGAQSAEDCVTSTNRQHLDAGRATRTFLTYRAVGSGDSLGISSTATTTLLRNGSSWSRVSSCPPPTTPSTPTTGPGSRPPLEQRYTATYSTDSRLPNHTIYRPTNLAQVTDRMPIVAWGNGACRADGTWFQEFLTPLAAHGVLVIANGNPGGSGQTNYQMLIESINWAIAENSRSGSPLNGKIDTNAVSVMGQSCGGIEAVDASADPRVDSTVLWNSGLFGTGTKPELDELHGPTAWFTGGESDIAYSNAVDDYAEIGSRVPAVIGHYGNVGHMGLFTDPAVERHIVTVAADWLDATLYNNAEARAQFVGTNCGLCRGTPWRISSKNW